MNKPTIMTLLSPRYELAYRIHDALLDHPSLSEQYEILMVPYSPGDEPMPDLSSYEVDGIITSLSVELENMQPLVDTGATVVNVGGAPCEGVCSIGVCPTYLAQSIVRHAVGAGFQSLVFLPTTGLIGQQQHQGRIFQELTQQAGLSYWQASVDERPLGVSVEEWSQAHAEVIDKIVQSPERTLIYAFHDWRATTLLEILQQRDVNIPGHIGVLGRGNTLNSKVGRLKVSSFSMPYLTIAQKSIELIQEKQVKNVLLSHGEVIPRNSSVGVHERGNAMHKLSEMIRSYGAEGISVDDLAKLAGTSRSTLERNYRKLYGEAPSAALKRVRMQHVEHLLRSTNLTIAVIAEMVGFSSTRSFFKMFEREHGIPPGQWRSTHANAEH